MEKETSEIIETLHLILEKMATKDDLAEIKIAVDKLQGDMQNGFRDLQSELKDIRQRLNALESAVQNISGYAKEIDHLIERVGAIEKHLGLRTSIAA